MLDDNVNDRHDRQKIITTEFVTHASRARNPRVAKLHIRDLMESY